MEDSAAVAVDSSAEEEEHQEVVVVSEVAVEAHVEAVASVVDHLVDSEVAEGHTLADRCH